MNPQGRELGPNDHSMSPWSPLIIVIIPKGMVIAPLDKILPLIHVDIHVIQC
jgi:hypothetical protein